MEASEDRGILKFYLDVGTIPGGQDAMNNQQLGGQANVLATVSVLRPLSLSLYIYTHAIKAPTEISLMV